MSLAASWEAERDDAEVVRLALVLNGGVSLAVWIGGVTHELDRLRRAFEMEQTSTYAQLLRCLGCVVRIDVIGGASAGGLNGAMLASAIAYGRSLETAGEIGGEGSASAGPWMRERWLELGDLAHIMRKPSNSEPGPSSLLDGDGGMLEPLRDLIFTELVPNTGPADTARCQPVTYVATTTDVVGDPSRRFDDYGAEFRDREHRALLEFIADPSNEWATTRDDDFVLKRGAYAAAELAERRKIARAQLALAARSTSSFPLAFEPAHWDQDASVTSFSSSRYLADGGIFDNAPFGRVIDAIRERRATRLSHRVLAYVCAYDDPLSVPDQAKEFAAAPTISEMIDLTLNKPRDVSMTAGLARLDQMRRGQDERLRPRDELVIAIASDPTLTALAGKLFDGYQLGRLEAALGRIVGRVQRDIGAADPSLNRDIDRTIALDAAIDGFAVPSEFSIEGEWRWGITAAKRGIDVLTDGLVYALALTPRDEENAQARMDLRTSRDALSHLWSQLDRLGDEIEHAEAIAFKKWADDANWIGQVFDARRSVLDAWPQGGELALGPAPTARNTIRDVLALSIKEVRTRQATLVRAGAREDADGDPAKGRYVRAIIGLLGDVDLVATPTDPDAAVLSAIATLEVLSVALGATASTDTPRFEVKRMTARAWGPDGARHEPGDKLAGLQLGHFGGFLKRSWRANDWMWGRLDAIDHITQLLLSPARLQRAKHPRELAALLVDLAGLVADSETAKRVADCITASGSAPGSPPAVSAQAAQAELEKFRRSMLVPALQRPILVEEIPSIQAARTIDRARDGKPALASAPAAAAPAAAETPPVANPAPISSDDVDVAVAGLSGLEPGAAASVLRKTLARETVSANFPSPSITRPTGDAIATGLRAFTTPNNRLPSTAQKPLRYLTPFAFLFYGLSQTPKEAHLRSIYRTGGLYIGIILAACALVFVFVYEAIRATAQAVLSTSHLEAAVIAVAAIAVVTCAMGLLAARALSRATLKLLNDHAASPRPTIASAAAGAFLSGSLGLPLAAIWLWFRGNSTTFEPYEEPAETKK